MCIFKHWDPYLQGFKKMTSTTPQDSLKVDFDKDLNYELVRNAVFYNFNRLLILYLFIGIFFY